MKESTAESLSARQSNSASHAAFAAAAFAAFLLFPSLGIVQKYFGTNTALVYFGFGSLPLIGIGLRARIVRSHILAVDRRWVPWATAATFAGLTLAFAVLYPIANSGVRHPLSPSAIVGGGSDRDESLNLGVRELLSGRYPYYPKTQLENSVTQMPGSLFLAVPFLLLGSVVWQNLFWLAAFFTLICHLFGDARLAVAFLWSMFVASPIVLQDWVAGSDLTANGIFVLAAQFLLLQLVPDPSVATWKKVGAAVFAGIAFSSRVNFLLLVPLLFAALARRASVRTGLCYSGVISVAFTTITLPFYWYDPAGFAPLYVHNKFAQFESAIPHSGIIFPGMSLLLSLFLSCRPGNREVKVWLIHCGLVQAFPVLLVMTLLTARYRWPDFALSQYGLISLLFGALGVGLWLFGGDANRKMDRE